MDYWPIIRELGAAQGVAGNTLKQWRRRGVPGKFRLPIVRDAAGRGIVIPDAALDRPAEAIPDASPGAPRPPSPGPSLPAGAGDGTAEVVGDRVAAPAGEAA